MIARQPPRTVEVYNDIDQNVYNVFATVKTGIEEILQLLEGTTHDRQQYKICRRVLTDPDESNIRKAWAFVVCGTIGFSAHPALANGCTRYERRRRALRTLPGKLHWWHKRLQPVHLENRTWQEIVERYDSPDTFFFCDPPYLPGVLRKACKYYQHDMDADAHVELIERLRKIKGRCMICGYHHPLYTQLLFHWRRITFVARESMGSRIGKRKEVVWLNYESDGSKIEGNRLRIARRYITIMGGEDEAVRYVERIKRLKQLLVLGVSDQGGNPQTMIVRE